VYNLPAIYWRNLRAMRPHTSFAMGDGMEDMTRVKVFEGSTRIIRYPLVLFGNRSVAFTLFAMSVRAVVILKLFSFL
jgi:hypothetical protein